MRLNDGFGKTRHEVQAAAVGRLASVRLDGDLPETECHIFGANILAAGTALRPLFAKPVSLRGLVLG